MSGYGKRHNSNEVKGTGFYGPLQRLDDPKSVSTEISIGVDFGKGEMEIPLLVPGMSREEINHLLSGGKPTRELVDKAVAHAQSRMGAGLPIFAGEGDQIDLPESEEEQFTEGFRSVRPSN
jgi:hypothetical protein